MKRFSFILILLIAQFVCFSQEICNNGIDDDNDGYIDLNDDECECIDNLTTTPTSLIPNPSFEEYDCLPTVFSQMDCAQDWIQASGATSDYFYVGSFVPDGTVLPEVPLPPDGNGFVGFATSYGQFVYYYSSNYIEYVGACLLSPIMQDSSYTFNFDIGFAESGIYSYGFGIESDSIELTFFANPDCASIPFSYGYYGAADCPTYSGNDWVELGSMLITGSNEWIQESFTFTADQDYNVLVIGGNCDNNYDISSLQYVFLDNLIVNTTSSFISSQISSELINCNNYDLTVNNDEGYDVQWYQNGVALVGETGNTLNVNQNINGDYLAVLTDGPICSTSNIVTLTATDLPSITILEGNFIEVEEGNSQQISLVTDASTYEVEWLNSMGLSCYSCGNPVFSGTENITYEVEVTDLNTLCRNNAFVEISIINNTDTTVIIDTMQVDTTSVDTTEVIIDPPIISNCEIYAPNVFSPNDDGINDYFEIRLTDCFSEDIECSIYNRFGEKVFQSSNAVNNGLIKWNGLFQSKTLNGGVFVYVITINYADNRIEHKTGNVTLIK